MGVALFIIHLIDGIFPNKNHPSISRGTPMYGNPCHPYFRLVDWYFPTINQPFLDDFSNHFGVPRLKDQVTRFQLNHRGMDKLLGRRRGVAAKFFGEKMRREKGRNKRSNNDRNKQVNLFILDIATKNGYFFWIANCSFLGG